MIYKNHMRSIFQNFGCLYIFKCLDWTYKNLCVDLSRQVFYNIIGFNKYIIIKLVVKDVF